MMVPQAGVVVPLEDLVALLALRETAVSVAVPARVVVLALGGIHLGGDGEPWWKCLQSTPWKNLELDRGHGLVDEVLGEGDECHHHASPCCQPCRRRAVHVEAAVGHLIAEALDQDHASADHLQALSKLDCLKPFDPENPKCSLPNALQCDELLHEYQSLQM